MFSPKKIDNYSIEENGFREYDSVLPNEMKSVTKMSTADYIIGQIQSESYCVGCVDIINSSQIIEKLGATKGADYAKIFLNFMSRILRRFGGFKIMYIGDCVLFYFPESAKFQRKFGFMSCIECGLSMIENHHKLTKEMQQSGLPPINYRISADYGSVTMTKTQNSKIQMIGPPITMSQDINHAASMNRMVIGSDLYERVKSLGDYKFKPIKSFSLGLRFSYPIYMVIRK